MRKAIIAGALAFTVAAGGTVTTGTANAARTVHCKYTLTTPKKVRQTVQSTVSYQCDAPLKAVAVNVVLYNSILPIGIAEPTRTSGRSFRATVSAFCWRGDHPGKYRAYSSLSADAYPGYSPRIVTDSKRTVFADIQC
ncbi:hypothetical protein GOEFS_021_00320 [Gordonia effusa NBRC 100432]|uniref:Secreted protein n=1 Tax=Gordonia effusa NBRC 100432 TaxID=1077974 RepID=H0QWK4_9ACTN|nr:hypothetical protein [Gordonia effusa]GAB17205.1 hypothetical protein GOEFS_021_00320 [Gordonia effusa NBRC 100432]